ncbi:MAG: nucleotidyltransferase domain-containing protein [bacterium]
MIDKETIKEVQDRLIKIYDPLEMYLFGSYAWGKPSSDSDLDLLIIVPESDETIHKRSLPGIRALIDLMISKDILVYTKTEFEKKADDVTTLCYKIKKEGKRIYAKLQTVDA